MTDPRDKKAQVDRYLKSFAKEAAREERQKIKRQKARKAAREPQSYRDRREVEEPDDWQDWEQDAPAPRERKRRRRGAADVPASTTQRARVLRCNQQFCDVLCEGEAGERRVLLTPADRSLGFVVGDWVAVEARGDTGLRVRAVLPRQACLQRSDPSRPRAAKVLAANVDLAVLVLAARDPAFKPALIERYLLAVDAVGIPVLVCVNKADLCEPDARAGIEASLAEYRQLGLTCLWVSAEAGEGLAELQAAIAGQTVVFSGHSGVGKSSLLNALDPEAGRRTGGGRAFDGKGRHTTTRAEMRALGGDSWWIDTPGVREFGLWEICPEDLRRGFRGFAALAPGCRFKDCAHRVEPDCAVRAAVTAGKVSPRRYELYLRLMDELSEA